MISRFIPVYPDKTIRGFEYEIARMTEFYDERLDVIENITGLQKGELLRHQKITSRFFSPNTPYDSGLIFHGLGAGKTCEAAAIEELTHSVKPNQKPALVFTKSNALQKTWVNELANVCTVDKYVPKYTFLEKKRGYVETADIKARRIKKQVLRHYAFETYQTFLKHLPKNSNSPEWDRIAKNYSGRNIILDEAHFLRIQSSKDAQTLYKYMWIFLHKLENVKVFLFTGTPIWDRQNEIASLMNLILPINEQLPVGREFDKTFFEGEKLINEDVLEAAFRGRVSYLRSMVSSAKKIEVGAPQPWLKHVVVYPSVMSDFQAKIARRANYKDLTEAKPEQKRDALMSNARSAMNLVFPDGSYGMPAYSNFVQYKKIGGEGDKVAEFNIPDPVKKELKKNLPKYSSKLAAIMKHIEDHPNELIFIYTGGFVSESGALSIAVILNKVFGYTWLKSSNMEKKDVSHKTFAVITSLPNTIHNDVQITDFLRNFNKPDNRYGDHCRIIIGSEKISVGFSIFNVRQVHIWAPFWNISENDQAIYRAIRLGGHNSLPPDERYIKVFRHVAVEKGKIPVSEAYPKGALVSDVKTADIQIYKIAENKDYKNSLIYRLMKEMSYDCSLTYKRNVLESDQPGSRECDYQDCNYTCHGFPEEFIEKEGIVYNYNIPSNKLVDTNYNLFYADEKTREFIGKIFEVFGIYFSLTLDQIYSLVGASDMFILLESLNSIINERMLIKNRYGFSSYLKEKNDVYFLDTTLSSKNYYITSEYTVSPFVTLDSTLDEINEGFLLARDKPVIDEMLGGSRGPKSKGVWKKLSSKAKKQLVRNVAKNQPDNMTCDSMFRVIGSNLKSPWYLNLSQKDRSLIESGIRKVPVKYSTYSEMMRYWSRLSYKAQVLIAETMFSYQTENKRIGANDKEPCRLVYDIVKSEMFGNIYKVTDKSDKPVYVHILNTQETTTSAHTVANKQLSVSGKMKIMIPYIDANRWSLITDKNVEDNYINQINKQRKDRQADRFADNKYDIYGTYEDNIFRLHLKSKKGEANKSGRTCMTYKIDQLFHILIRVLKYEAPGMPADFVRNKANVPDLQPGDSKGDWTDAEVYTLTTLSGTTKDAVCELIEKQLKKYGLLYTN